MKNQPSPVNENQNSIFTEKEEEFRRSSAMLSKKQRNRRRTMERRRYLEPELKEIDRYRESHRFAHTKETKDQIKKNIEAKLRAFRPMY